MTPPHARPSAAPLLPVLERRDEIAAAIQSHQVVVLCGQTGSGKTTQLPQICLDLGRGKTGMIGHTQPRRIAARAVAARIAEERGVRLGGLVGFAVRFQDQTSRDTRIKVMTDGVLLAELAGDPLLRAYDTLIIDEAHERSLNIDFLLGCLRGLLARRPDLKLIITSATIDTDRFSKAFGGPAKAPVLEVSGRMYPVEIRYHPTRADRDERGGPEELDIEAVADAVEELARPGRPTGDTLVFLPGEREIRAADAAIKRRGVDADVLPLFSRLTSEEQDRIFHPSPSGRRRVILATNVAETSLTVPGIRYVVDTGLARINRYDPQRKVQGLPIEPISRASADQRAGRCGRVAEGVCIRLYSEESYRARPAFTDPEIRRSSLASVILRMKSAGLGEIEKFPFLDPPDAAAIRDGYETLFELGAIDSARPDAALTPIGRDMARVPLDPRIARMLLAAEREQALEETLVLAAALEIQDPRQRPLGRQDEADRSQIVFQHPASDFLTLLNIWEQFRHAAATMTHGALAVWCREHFLSLPRMREWSEMVGQLRGVASDLALRLPRRDDQRGRLASDDAIHRALLTGLITHVACREGDGSFDYRGVRGNTVQIFPGSVLFKKGPKWIMAAEVVHTSRLFARTVARIDPEWIEELAGHMFKRQLSDHHLDPDTGEPSAWERVTMSGIVVVPRRRTPIAAIDPTAARLLFLRDGLARGKWTGETPFMQHNRHTLAAARAAEAKLRRRNLVIDDDALAAWFDARVPANVRDAHTLYHWLASAPHAAASLQLSLADVLRPEARAAIDPAAFPDSITLPDAGAAALEYHLAPGKDEDGITATLALTSLPALTDDRAAWLVPGLLPDLVQSLIKTLPKPARAAIEAKGALADVADAVAGVLSFGEGPLAAALSEALDVLHGVTVAPADWSFKSLPAHLRLRIRVVDDHGKELAASRDLPDLRQRLDGRLKKALAARARSTFERRGVTTWDFGDLPDRVDRDDGQPPAFPTIIDEGASVSLTLIESEPLAQQLTAMGVRRLFALAAREELQHHLAALPAWSDMTRHFAALGPADQFRDDLTALIAERAFMAGQPAVRTRAAFDDRVASCWGRLTVCTREVADVIARALEPRFRVAHRFSGGTPRLWAASVADIREHAAYLMPRGFLLLVPWDKLRHYPRYAEAMRARLFALREEGSRVETDALTKFAPHWKRFTGWVAAAMSAERAALEAAGDAAEAHAAPRSGKTKAPLPQARRAAPTVNLDAGEWAMQPGHLPPALQHYRWLLEDLRVALFAPDLAAGTPVTTADLDQAWAKVGPPRRGA